MPKTGKLQKCVNWQLCDTMEKDCGSLKSTQRTVRQDVHRSRTRKAEGIRMFSAAVRFWPPTLVHYTPPRILRGIFSFVVFLTRKLNSATPEGFCITCFQVFLEKAKMHSFPKGETRPAKRTYGFLRVANTEHRELHRLLSRRETEALASRESPSESIYSPHNASKTSVREPDTPRTQKKLCEQ